MSRSRSLNKLFNDAEGVLATVIARSAALSAIEAQVTEAIPTLLKQQVWLADIRDHTLTLICSSNVIANRLRFMEYQLLNELSGQHGLGLINQLKVKVNRDWREANGHDHRATSRANIPHGLNKTQGISASSADLIKQTGLSVRNPKLAEALKRLANRSTETTR